MAPKKYNLLRLISRNRTDTEWDCGGKDWIKVKMMTH